MSQRILLGLSPSEPCQFPWTEVATEVSLHFVIGVELLLFLKLFLGGGHDSYYGNQEAGLLLHWSECLPLLGREHHTSP